MNQIYEPPINPDEDTSPSLAVRPEEGDAQSASGAPALWGWLSLSGAVIFTVAAIIILLLPPASVPVPPAVENLAAPESTEVVATDAVVIPTQLPDAVVLAQPANQILPPVVDSGQLASLLTSPLEFVTSERIAYRYTPFTIINTDRPRSGFIEYVAIQGDTVDDIASRYGIAAESIAWCNNRRIIQVLRPGDVLAIPPVDGACHLVLGTREETIAGIATQFEVTDPYTIIDYPYNYERLPTGITPNDILPGGTELFIPGGKGEIITWRPPVAIETDASGQVVGVTYASGQSGSCGRITPGGGSYWGNPLPNGTWVRGFYAGHSGIDLAAPTGTPVYAANSGYVLFAGFSRWGYGNAVVVEHGPYISTLYGHMSSLSVSCGQFVSTGQVIGLVGSTGISSGPHLHFEIRSGENPTDPTATAGIGW